LPVLIEDPQNMGKKLKKFLTPHSRLLTNSSSVEDCTAAKLAPRGFKTLANQWIAVLKTLEILATPHVMTFGEGDHFNDLAESESEGGGYTQLQALLMAELYEYPKWTDGISSDETLREHRDRRNQGSNHDYNMQTYYQGLREEMEAASSSFKWWTRLTSQLQYYGGICSILIMLFLIGGASMMVFRQARKYREELASCLCGNFWISRLIQVCTLDSWKNGHGVSREMRSLGGRKEIVPLDTPKRNNYADSSLDQTPSSQTTTLLSSMPSPYSPSSSDNWMTSLGGYTYPNLSSESSTNSSTSRENALKHQEVRGVRPVRPDHHGRSRSPVDRS
jgi:hypothetical protein